MPENRRGSRKCPGMAGGALLADAAIRQEEGQAIPARFPGVQGDQPSGMGQGRKRVWLGPPAQVGDLTAGIADRVCRKMFGFGLTPPSYQKRPGRWPTCRVRNPDGGPGLRSEAELTWGFFRSRPGSESDDGSVLPIFRFLLSAVHRDSISTPQSSPVA